MIMQDLEIELNCLVLVHISLNSTGKSSHSYLKKVDPTFKSDINII